VREREKLLGSKWSRLSLGRGRESAGWARGACVWWREALG